MNSQHAQAIWEKAASPRGNHQYLYATRIGRHGVRRVRRAHIRMDQLGRLVVPMYDKRGNLKSLQFITTLGKEQFLNDVKPLALSCPFFNDRAGRKTVHICQSIADAVTVAMITKQTIVCAFGAGSLTKIAKQYQERFPDSQIVICAVNDAAGRNQGCTAAKAVGGRLVIPPSEKECTWNAFYCSKGKAGKAVVRRYLKLFAGTETREAKKEAS